MCATISIYDLRADPKSHNAFGCVRLWSDNLNLFEYELLRRQMTQSLLLISITTFNWSSSHILSLEDYADDERYVLLDWSFDNYILTKTWKQNGKIKWFFLKSDWNEIIQKLNYSDETVSLYLINMPPVYFIKPLDCNYTIALFIGELPCDLYLFFSRILLSFW